MRCIPHAAGVAHLAELLLVIAALGLTGAQLAFQTLALVVHQEFNRLQAADAVELCQAGPSAQLHSLGVFLPWLSLYFPAKGWIDTLIDRETNRS